MRGNAERWLRLRDAAAVVLIWLAAFALAILVSHASLAAAALPAGIALGVAVLGSRWPLSRRVAAACALVAAGVEPAAVLPWTLAAVCLSAVVSAHAGAVSEPALSDLDRHLERIRRRGEPATVLVLEMEANVTVLRDLLGCTRVSDSLVVRRSRSRFEVYGLLEGCDLARENVHARFAEALDGVTPAFGWASYPADGLTLDALLERARESILTTSASSRRPAAEASRIQPHIEPVIELGAEHA
jgi:hypothetical protein